MLEVAARRSRDRSRQAAGVFVDILAIARGNGQRARGKIKHGRLLATAAVDVCCIEESFDAFLDTDDHIVLDRTR